jgi:hypothetical protein
MSPRLAGRALTRDLLRYFAYLLCLGTAGAGGRSPAGRRGMTALKIRPAATEEVRGDLRAKFDHDELLLPERIAQLFSALGIRTATDLASYLQAFPSAIAGELGWEPQDVVHAWQLLRTQLKGRVDKQILDPPSRPNPVFGAFPPAGMSPRGASIDHSAAEVTAKHAARERER